MNTRQELSRTQLIEKIESANGMIPPFLTILFEYGKPINKQSTHALRLIHDGLKRHFNNNLI